MDRDAAAGLVLARCGGMRDTASDPHQKNSDTWALVLAGGDGTRLRDITRAARRRADPEAVLPDHRRALDARVDARPRPAAGPPRAHDGDRQSRSSAPRRPAAAQACRGRTCWCSRCNRRHRSGHPVVAARAPAPAAGRRVAMFPSDHYVAHDRAFQTPCAVRCAWCGGRRGSSRCSASSPRIASPEYGYVLPASPLDGGRAATRSTWRRSRRSPARGARRAFVRRGGLWNSFVMTFRVARALELLRAAARRSATSRWPRRAATRGALESHYAASVPWNFSNDFLARVAPELVVVRAERHRLERLGHAARDRAHLRGVEPRAPLAGRCRRSELRRHAARRRPEHRSSVRSTGGGAAGARGRRCGPPPIRPTASRRARARCGARCRDRGPAPADDSLARTNGANRLSRTLSGRTPPFSTAMCTDVRIAAVDAQHDRHRGIAVLQGVAEQIREQLQDAVGIPGAAGVALDVVQQPGALQLLELAHRTLREVGADRCRRGCTGRLPSRVVAKSRSCEISRPMRCDDERMRPPSLAIISSCG